MFKRSSGARDALMQAAERASEAGRRLVEIGSAMQERAQDAVRTTRRSSRDYSGQMREYVTEHPLTAIGITVAITAVLAALFARR
jgi:ElaB/YqjD/DUF883 family membrane-anchored ribosome-binding protein